MKAKLNVPYSPISPNGPKKTYTKIEPFKKVGLAGVKDSIMSAVDNVRSNITTAKNVVVNKAKAALGKKAKMK